MQELSTGSIGKLFRSYLVPTVTASLSLAAYCIVDTIFIGLQTGRLGLAAVNLAIPIFTVYGALGLLLGIGTSTSISICRGQHNEQEAQHIFTLGTLLTIGVGVLVSILSVAFLKPYARLLGAEGALLQPTLLYMLPVCIGSFAFIITKSLSIIVRNDQGPRLVMIASLTGNIINVVLDYILMFPLDMGILGASLATLCSPLVSLVILAFHFRRGSQHLHFVKGFWQASRFRRILKNGTAASLEELTAGLVILFFNKSLLHWGTALHVAAFSIISEISFVARAVFDGISHAAQPLLSYNYGAGQSIRVRATLKMAIAWSLGVALLVYGVFLLFPERMINLFLRDDPELVATTIAAGHLYFTALLFQGLNIMMMYFFQSIERPANAFQIAILRGLVFLLPTMLLLGWRWGTDGLWLTLTVAEAATACCACCSWQYDRHQTKRERS